MEPRFARPRAPCLLPLLLAMLAGCAGPDGMSARQREATAHARASEVFRVLHGAIGGQAETAEAGWIQCGTFDRYRYHATARVRPADMANPQAQRQAMLQAMTPLGFAEQMDKTRAHPGGNTYMLSLNAAGRDDVYVNAWREASGRDTGVWVFAIEPRGDCVQYQGTDRAVVESGRKTPLS